MNEKLCAGISLLLSKNKSLSQYICNGHVKNVNLCYRVHIRRTDKVGTEAAFHPIEEYMAAVDEYYNLLEMKQEVDQRRVYLASDDPKVIAEAQKK